MANKVVSLSVTGRIRVPGVAVRGGAEQRQDSVHRGGGDVDRQAGQRAPAPRLCRVLLSARRQGGRRQAARRHRGPAEGDARTMREAGAPDAEAESNGRRR